MPDSLPETSITENHRSKPKRPDAQPAENHPSVSYGKTGVLLIALGTPSALTVKAVRRYLSEFLGDPRVVEFPSRWLWKIILNGIILPFRSPRSLKAYARIWDQERDESPLRTISRDQGEKLAAEFKADFGDDVVVDWAFRYGDPSLESRIRKMKEAGVERLICFALYPQYSSTTTGSSYEEVFRVLSTMRWQPAVRTVPAYVNDPVFMTSLGDSVRTSLAGLDFTPEKVLASYHSIPQDYWEKGDLYPCHCHKTSRLLREEMGWNKDDLETSFQSRVGPKKWVGPSTEDTAIRLAKEGVKKLVVLTPAFSADCLETLEEIDMELRETFLEHGGTHFHMIPCLNASDLGMKVISHVVRREGQGWL